MQAAAIQEAVFLNEKDVVVTNTRFMIPGQMFVMSGITSVSLARTSPSLLGPVVMILVGLVMLLGGFGGEAYGLLVFGAAVLALGVLWAKGSKSTYHVVLRTSAGEQRALSSRDHAYIGRVVEALNNAIIARG